MAFSPFTAQFPSGHLEAMASVGGSPVNTINGQGYHVDQFIRQQQLAHQQQQQQNPAQHQAQNSLQLQNSAQQGPPQPSDPPKHVYGAGDSEDGYTLVFENMEAFNTWRLAEEESKCIEFVKGDMHQSKAVPPRFKEHTKLVCARHTRAGRKKYVKKHPDRQRKVPSRKIEGEGCPASVSFKTYFGTDQIRACYNPAHSHDIGAANLPFTRRGRKAMASAKESKKRRRTATNDDATAQAADSEAMRGSSTNGDDGDGDNMMNGTDDAHDDPNRASSSASPSTSQATASLSLSGTTVHTHSPSMRYHPVATSSVQQQPQQAQPPPQVQHMPLHASPAALQHHPHPHPHPQPQQSQPQQQQQQPQPPPPQQRPQPQSLPMPSPLAIAPNQDRWERMAVLFDSVRNHARTVEYATPSVVALETILIRLYLESPLASVATTSQHNDMNVPSLGLGLNMGQPERR